MDKSQPDRNENESDKRARDFAIGALETIAFFVGLSVVSRATGISFDSTAFAILFLFSGLAVLGLTLLIVRTRRRR